MNPDEESFVPVYLSLYGPLRRYFIVRGVDAPTAEELAQDVLLVVFRRSGEVRNSQCVTGWLYQVARNTLLQHVRKRGIRVESIIGVEASVSPSAMRTDSELFEWIEVLEADEREICLMRYMDGLDYVSIAAALRLPMGTVKWKLHQVKKKLAIRIGLANTGKR